MWWWFCSSGQWSHLLQRHSECHLHNVKTCSDLWNSLGGLEESQRAQICQEGLGPKYLFAPPWKPGSSLHQLSQDQETRELHQEAKDPALFHFLHHCKWQLVLQSSKQQLHQDWCFCKVSIPLEKSWSSCCTLGIHVNPPTDKTSWMEVLFIFASLRHFSTGSMHFLNMSTFISSNLEQVMVV